MFDAIVTVLLWLSALGCAVMAGLYFAFSAFIMRALGEIDRAAGIAAMIAINRVILRSAFMPVFLGSTLTSLALAVIALLRWGEPGTAAMLAGAAVYVLGMFGVTMARNVPLNNRLIAAGDDGTWALYLTVWTRWNHVRTLASAAGLVLFVVALIELGANG
jgi:uncharacterized membrane protein